jgi:formamidopyrimidine-DNA glycosylase
MPESPEVYNLVKNVLSKYIGKKLNNIKINFGRYKTHGPPDNFNKFKKAFPIKCINVYKKGKVIFICFENDWYIISKLGLMGWWNIEGYQPEWRSNNKKNVVFSFNNSKDLIYDDNLSFGSITITNNLDIIEKELYKLAPDISDKKNKFSDIQKRIDIKYLKIKNKLIEDVIIDQQLIFSGIGNYLKSEILYESKISPLRKIKDITLDEWKQIFIIAQKFCNKMQKILNSNNTNKYFNEMKVYQKKYDPYGNQIKTRKTIEGRTTFYVESIQI